MTDNDKLICQSSKGQHEVFQLINIRVYELIEINIIGYQEMLM